MYKMSMIYFHALDCPSVFNLIFIAELLPSFIKINRFTTIKQDARVSEKNEKCFKQGYTGHSTYQAELQLKMK